MDGLIRDVRYSLRMLLKVPGMTLVAVASLALGIGANTTIFTLINAVFLNPIPVERPSELVALYTVDESAANPFSNLNPLSRPNYLDLREQSGVFTDLCSYTFPFPVNLATGGEPEQVFTELVSGNYFDVLGVRPLRGRFFRPDEDEAPGTHPVVVMGHGLWQRRFGGDPGVIGREIEINGLGFSVVGVAPEGFKGVNALGGPELWAPSAMYGQVLPAQFTGYFDDRRALMFLAAGRLAAGASVDTASAAVATVGARLAQEYPGPNKDRNFRAVPLTEATIFPGIRQVLLQGGIVLMAVVALVLLIACSNVASLLLGRATARRKEISIRLALGAGRRALVRQLLVESVLLALLGGAAGLLVAFWGRDFIWAFRPPFLQQAALDLSLDAQVLGFTALVALVTGVLFGLAPALQASKPDVVEVLKEEGRGNAGRRATLRNGLVVAQVALSVVALVAAGLFLRSLGSAQDTDPGFETERLAVLTVNPGQQGYEGGRTEQLYRQLLERCGALPGTRGVALAANPPLFGGFARTVFLDGQPAEQEGGKGVMVNTNVVSPGYFEVMGIAHVSGRDFDERDRPEAVPVVIVNEEMGEQLWPGEQVVGKRFSFYGEDAPVEVVGVVRNSNYITIGEAPQPTAFLPLWQNPADTMTLHLRSAGEPGPALLAARREIRRIDPGLPLTNAWTVAEVIDQSLWAPKLGAALLAVLGALALLLAAVGLYGVMAFWVSQRNREIGIRMALGAPAPSVLRMVLGQCLLLVGLGLALGGLAAWLLGGSLAALLYGISPNDPLTFVSVMALLLAVALAASLLPALRAVRVDPLRALRVD
jgi:predicted permease